MCEKRFYAVSLDETRSVTTKLRMVARNTFFLFLLQYALKTCVLVPWEKESFCFSSFHFLHLLLLLLLLPLVLHPCVELDLLDAIPPLLSWLCINSPVSAPNTCDTSSSNSLPHLNFGLPFLLFLLPPGLVQGLPLQRHFLSSSSHVQTT
jgi:hypothetical protein